jgi:hypothetical protein
MSIQIRDVIAQQRGANRTRVNLTPGHPPTPARNQISYQYDPQTKPSPLDAPPDAITVTIPTPWYLWPVGGPSYAWACLLAAMVLWGRVEATRKVSSRP